jgi:hypothetical protein
MTNIYFHTNGVDPNKLVELRPLLSGWHIANDAPIGVAFPAPSVSPNEVDDALTAAGFIVLPGVHDSSTPVHDVVATTFKAHGVKPGMTTQTCLRTIHQALKHPWLRPSLH